MQQNKEFEKSILVKAYFIFGVAMYFFFYKLISNAMLSQLSQPVFLLPEKEWFYKIYLQSGIAQFITTYSFIAAVMDISLLISAVGFLLSQNRWFAVAFTAAVFNYFITFNLVTAHHYHGLIGLLIITLPFWFKGERNFTLAWDGCRYYFLYIFASAGLWKVFRGSAFYEYQLSDILKAQQLNMLLQNPDFVRSHIATYLIANPPVAHIILLVNVVVQLSFLIGFFTRKFDLVLLLLAIVFTFANFFIMSIISAELLILGLTLLNWKKIEDFLEKKGAFTT